nr:MAG TPA: hypothetical protein [Caudoviricetes sp.]
MEKKNICNAAQASNLCLEDNFICCHKLYIFLVKHEFWCKDKHFERKRLNVCHKFSFQRVERIRINNEPGNVSR